MSQPSELSQGTGNFDATLVQLPRDMALLQRFYTELMQPNFPISDELESLEVWVDQLYGRGRDGKELTPINGKNRCTLNIVIVTDRRGPNATKRPIVGGIVFEYYHPSNCALITYLVISPEARGHGLAIFITIQAWAVMCQTSTRFGHDNPFVIFCECNNPLLVSDSDDAYSPLNRLRAFQSAGVRAVGGEFVYIQPSLSANQSSCRDMLLAAVVGPMTERDDKSVPFIRCETVQQFLIDFYSELGVDVSVDADFKEMAASLKGKTTLPLVDFDLSRFKKSKRQNKQTAVTKSSTLKSPYHVVVVGAGLSGLVCARELQAYGISVTVIEARHRLGGRVYTGRTFETRVDFGASWLHGVDGNPLAEYAETNIKDMRLYKSNEQAIALFDVNGKKFSDSEIMTTYMKFMQLMEAVDEAYAATDEKTIPNPEKYAAASTKFNKFSLQQAINTVYQSNPSYKYANRNEKIIMNYLFSQQESLQNASMQELCAQDYGFGITYEGGDNIIASGFYQLPQSLASNLNLQLSTKCTSIIYNNSSEPGHRVHVKCTEDKSFDCDAVVVSVPIGVLHASTIEFTPALPTWKTTAINNIGSGLFNKVILQFPTVFWDKGIDYFGCMFDPSDSDYSDCEDLSNAHCRRSNCWFTNLFPVVNKPILIAMLSGDLAKNMETAEDSVITSMCMRRLQRMFGKSIPIPLDVRITRWGSDEFSRGSYSYLKVGCLIDNFDDMGKPVGGKVFWCGEHTSRERFGYADGAYSSGLREAKRIIQQIESKLPSKL